LLQEDQRRGRQVHHPICGDFIPIHHRIQTITKNVPLSGLRVMGFFSEI
jgi:hypothetical protein